MSCRRPCPTRRARARLPYVWILPIIVVIVGAFVAVREKLAEGTSIEITFHTADDLEPNKTKISYKAVEIGEVKEIHVSKDRQEVVVEARIHRNATRLSGPGHALLGGAAARDRREHLRPRDAGLGCVHRRRCGPLGRPRASLHRSRGSADRDLRSARARVRPARGRHRLPQHRLGGVLPPHAGGPGRRVFAGPGRRERHHQGLHQLALRPVRHAGHPVLAGERHRHVDRLRGREAAHRVARLHSGRRRRIPVAQGIHIDRRDGGGHLLQAVLRPGARHARGRHRRGDLHHVLSGVAARTVGGCAGRSARHRHRRGQAPVRRVRSGRGRAALPGGSRHLSAANPIPGASDRHAEARTSPTWAAIP